MAKQLDRIVFHLGTGENDPLRTVELKRYRDAKTIIIFSGDQMVVEHFLDPTWVCTLLPGNEHLATCAYNDRKTLDTNSFTMFFPNTEDRSKFNNFVVAAKENPDFEETEAGIENYLDTEHDDEIEEADRCVFGSNRIMGIGGWCITRKEESDKRTRIHYVYPMAEGLPISDAMWLEFFENSCEASRHVHFRDHPKVPRTFERLYQGDKSLFELSSAPEKENPYEANRIQRPDGWPSEKVYPHPRDNLY